MLSEWTTLLFAFLFMVFIFSTVALMESSRLPPESTKLKKISLKRKPNVESPQMTAFLLGNGALPHGGKRVNHVFSSKNKSGAWLKDPAKIEADLKKYTVPLKRFQKALESKGCLPTHVATSSRARHFQWVQLIRGVKWLSLKTILLTQKGRPNQAAAMLSKIDKKLYGYTQACSPNLIGLLVTAAAQRYIRQAAVYILRHSSLQSQWNQQLMQRLFAWEKAKNPMGEAMKAEGEFRQRFLKKMKGSVNASSLPSVWPWFSRKESLEIDVRTTRCQIQRVLLPAHLLPGPTCDIETFLKKTSSLPVYFRAVEYNATGRILLGIAKPTFAKYAIKWHQLRCANARLRARLLHAWPSVRRTVKGQPTPLPVNPFLRKVIHPSQKSTLQCTHSTISLSQVSFIQLPVPVSNPSTQPSK